MTHGDLETTHPTILLVEDEPALREGTGRFLRTRGYRVLTAEDGQSALAQVQQADIIILDIMLPDMTGLEVLEQLRQVSDVPVLIVTALGDEATQISSFNRLADDYVTKPFSLTVLDKRLQALLRRHPPLPKRWHYGKAEVDFAAYTSQYAGRDAALTPKEIQLLKLFVSHPGRVWSRQAILDALWTHEELPFDRVIDVYVKNLRKRLHLDCIVTVKGVGYRYEAPNVIS